MVLLNLTYVKKKKNVFDYFKCKPLFNIYKFPKSYLLVFIYYLYYAVGTDN